MLDKIRFTHNPMVLPFLFLMSGISDYIIGYNVPIITFFIWFYLGISSIFLFMGENICVVKEFLNNG